MLKREFDKLKAGDIVSYGDSANCYVVTAHYGTYVIAAATAKFSGPENLEKVELKPSESCFDPKT